ncbi:META domain-containing protein [Pseudidiomarina donghaiensis]|uniref:META domain-containing protein n=1 Tax=Pseudidiomarina donghaiensis TaxID=519452 RepID=UPI003A9721A2
MLSRRLLTGAVVISTLVAACSPSDQNKTVLYNCGVQPITAEFTAKRLTLIINNETLLFSSEPTASGARYFNPDHNAQFWTKGNEGQLVIDDNVYPLCIAAGSLPQQFSARGNEPFWLLQRKGPNASLRRPAGDRDFTQVNVTDTVEDNRWQVQLDNDSVLALEQKVCVDSMSGMPYPYVAKLTHNQQELTGCAGEPRQLLAGATWQLQGSNLSKAPTLTFMNDGKVHGFAGCNQFFGAYRLTGEGLAFERMAATKMMCSPAEMAIEDTYLQQLSQVRSFGVETNQLILQGANKQLVFQLP